MRDPNHPCIFCTPRGVTRRNALAYCARDSYPVSPGHSLIIPLRHCASFFDLTPAEIAACMELVREERAALDGELEPAGYNIGVNVGRAGGQSVLHAHVHLIPRYAGDHPKPQGGVRQIIPWKADYPRGPLPAGDAVATSGHGHDGHGTDGEGAT
jgi:diadenosine tetraphosphate (Ap4A) HIT family hydrolase